MRNVDKTRTDTAGAADYLSKRGNPIAASTLTTWRCTKRYPLPYYRAGSKIYYDIDDLEAFLESRKVHPVSV